MTEGGKPLVLTTGGAGYIGTHTIVELVGAGYQPVILDNFCNANRGCIANLEKVCKTKLQLVDINLCDKDALNELFDKFKFEYVIHFAALKSVGESVEIPLAYYENNVTGFINLLQVMASHNVKKIVYSSSCTVYGNPSKLPLTEDCDVGKCSNPYGTTKYIGECMLRDLATSDKNWSILNLRYFNPVGAHVSGMIGEDAGPSPKNIFPCILKTAAKLMDHVRVFGNDYKTTDGTGVRDYIHVVDLSKGHVAAMKYLDTFKGCKSFNLGTGRGYSVLELIKAIEETSGVKIKYTIEARRPGDLDIVYADTSLAEKELKWKAKLGLKEMCTDAWRWQCQFPNGYSQAAGDT